MALEKIVSGILGLVAGVALASQVNAQTIEYVPDSTGKMQTIVNYGNISYNPDTKETAIKDGTGYSHVYNESGKIVGIQKDNENSRYLIDPKTGRMMEVPIIRLGKTNSKTIDKSDLEKKIQKTPVPKEKPKSTYELGNDAFAKGDYQTAIDQYQKVLNKTKNTSLKVDLLYKIGLCYDNLDPSGSGSNGQAQKYYEKATQIGEKRLAHGGYDPKKLAQIYAQWARGPPFDLALKQMQRAHELDPTNKKINQGLENVKFNLENYK